MDAQLSYHWPSFYYELSCRASRTKIFYMWMNTGTKDGSSGWKAEKANKGAIMGGKTAGSLFPLNISGGSRSAASEDTQEVRKGRASKKQHVSERRDVKRWAAEEEKQGLIDSRSLCGECFKQTIFPSSTPPLVLQPWRCSGRRTWRRPDKETNSQLKVAAASACSSTQNWLMGP